MKLNFGSWIGSLGVASAAGLLALGVACSRDASPVSVPVEERASVALFRLFRLLKARLWRSRF